jgi:hypothetical protein
MSSNELRRAKAKRDQYLHAIRKAKTGHWKTFLENARSKDIFKAISYIDRRQKARIFSRCLPPIPV